MSRNLVACRAGCGAAVPDTTMRACDRCWGVLSPQLRAGIRRCQVWLENHPGDASATRVLLELVDEAEREWSMRVFVAEATTMETASPNFDVASEVSRGPRR